MDRATLAAKHEESLRALHSGAAVVFQAAFFDGVFHGRCRSAVSISSAGIR